jgi:hypothetical protein
MRLVARVVCTVCLSVVVLAGASAARRCVPGRVPVVFLCPVPFLVFRLAFGMPPTHVLSGIYWLLPGVDSPSGLAFS